MNLDSSLFFCSLGLIHIGRVGSVWCILAVTIDRYINVCLRTCQCKAKSLLLPFTVVFSIIYNIPKFFELRKRTEEDDAADAIAFNATSSPDYYDDIWNTTMTSDFDCGWVILQGTHIDLSGGGLVVLIDGCRKNELFGRCDFHKSKPYLGEKHYTVYSHNHQ